MANGAARALHQRPFKILGARTWPDALRIVRCDRGFSFRDVANAVCRDKPNLPKQWEMGQALPSKYDLRRLYNAMPKLREAADLLPGDLREPEPSSAAPPLPAPTPEPEAAPPTAPVAVIVAADKPPVIMAAPPPPPPPAAPPAKPSPDVSKCRTFGEALGVLIAHADMTHGDFGKVVGITQSTISCYVRGVRQDHHGKTVRTRPVSMTRIVYERILAVLPELKNAPSPNIYSRDFGRVPGKISRAELAADPAKKHAASLRADAAEAAKPTRRPLPPMPETVRKPVTPARKTAPAEASVAAGIERAGADWGRAIARVQLAKAELEAAEAEAQRAHDAIQAAIKAAFGG
jgi:hypothetical protein